LFLLIRVHIAVMVSLGCDISIEERHIVRLNARLTFL
jgi:hypothetical protein